MRTTLVIDDDVLMAAKVLAALQRKSVGQVISLLARQALRPNPQVGRVRNGVPLLPIPSGVAPMTPKLVNQIRDE
ncbi:MAG TPA: hypothetical protein VGZ00_12765 [Candidatus Baltobacteraceae bacterium]|jgi:hypothetical protein|nr:hypothetical protein [Candidatus Baltobacteraceae bacterium]